MGQFENFRIGHASQLLVIVKRLKPLIAVSGTVYRLTSCMSDHMWVLYNVFENWNELPVVLHIFFACTAVLKLNRWYNRNCDHCGTC